MSRRFLLERTTIVPAPLPQVFDFFSNPNNLARITPQGMGFRIVNPPARKLRAGDVMDYVIRVFGIPLQWRTRIESWSENESFSDLQERGPYKYWLHTHSFRAVGDQTEMLDRVEYELPFGILGLVALPFVRRELKRIFDFRGRQIVAMFGSERAS